MKRIALLLLIVVLAACGSSSDSDDTGSSADSASGAVDVAATSVADDEDSDETEAEEPPTHVVVTDVEPMAEPDGAKGVRSVLAVEFDDPERSKFLVGEFENGAISEVVDGVYRISPANGMTQIMLPTSIPAVNDGIIDVNVSIEGSGAVGVSIRSRKDPQGTFSGYVCWISEPAGAGCSLNTKDDYTLMFSAPVESIQLQEANALRLAMIDDKLQFEVNGVVVGQLADSTYVSGNWGLYAESAEDGNATGTFDDVVVYRVTSSYELP